MRTKITALFTAFIVILVGFLGVNYISNTSRDTKGTQSEVPETTSSEIPENQSVRLFENEIDYEIDNLLRILGAIAELQIIEIVDASFAWNTPDSSTEIVGKGLIITNTSSKVEEALLVYLEENGFEQDAINLEADTSGRKYGYLGSHIVCIVRSLIDKEVAEATKTEALNIEIRCGEFEEPSAEENGLNQDETTDTITNLTP